MILDIIVIAIVVFFIVLGYKHGAASTIISFVGLILSVSLSSLMGDYLSAVVYNNYLSNEITESVYQYLCSTQSATVQQTINSMPDFVKAILNTLDFQSDDNLTAVIKQVPEQAANAVESIVAPIVTSVLAFIFTAVLFIVVYLVFRALLQKPLTKIFRLPFVRGIDSIVGVVISFLCSLLLISFLAFLLKTLMPNVNMPYILSEDTIYNSYIFYHFYNGNIFSKLTSIF